MQKLSIISQMKSFNKHVLIDHFHFKHEMKMKEKYFARLGLNEADTFKSRSILIY